MLPPAAINAIQSIFGNCAQQLNHRGPVNITTAGQQPSLFLGNGYPSKPPQTALETGQGNVIIGPASPKGASNPNQLTVNNNSTFNNYVTFNDPINLNNDIRLGPDLIFKYCVEGFGSTIARVQLTQSASPDQTVPAKILNGSCQQANAGDSSGTGGGMIPVKLPCCLSGSDKNSCLPPGTCGYAIYMSDTAEGGAAADCGTMVNTGHWELINVYSVPNQQNKITYVTDVKVCCSVVNGQSTIVTCVQKETDTICAPIQKGEPTYGDPPCPC